MPLPPVVTLSRESEGVDSYENHPVAQVNDHEVRFSVMTEPYVWHSHPDSDECFLAIEGTLVLEFDEGSVELQPGQMITVPRGIRHRTRPLTARSVNLTFERTESQTLLLPPAE